MKRVLSILFLCTILTGYSLNACPICSTKVAYRNNKAPFFSNTYYKTQTMQNDESSEQQEEREQESSESEYNDGENRLHQVQEIEAENLAEDMGDL